MTRRKPSDKSTARKPRLSCPFHQAYRVRQRKKHSMPKDSCLGKGFANLPRVVEHLKKHHTTVSDTPVFGYITKKTLDKIAQLPKKKVDESPKDKWDKIYRLIHGDDDSEIPPPYHHLQNVEDLVRIIENPPDDLFQSTQRLLNSRSAPDHPPVNASVYLGVLPDILRMIGQKGTSTGTGIMTPQTPEAQTPTLELPLTTRGLHDTLVDEAHGANDEYWGNELGGVPSDFFDLVRDGGVSFS